MPSLETLHPSPSAASTSEPDSLVPLHAALAEAESIVLGKPHELRLAVACLLAQGHLLIEDLPGMGKTTLASTLARMFGLQFQRLQFTSDLLPADILGVSVFDRQQASFRFVPGPVFCQLLLADEINRATPKTQSALLEAMEERQVSTEGETRPLPQPFFVIATQNPSHQIGTFPLPESQLDRFLMRLSLGYPDARAERQLLSQGDTRSRLLNERQQATLLSPAKLQAWQAAAQRVSASPALLDYLQALLQATRHDSAFEHGLSPRAGLALLAASRAWALLAGRDFVLPEDVQQVFGPVARHRLVRVGSGELARADDVSRLIEQTPIP